VTEEQLDEVHRLKEEISRAVTALVNKMTKGIDPEIDELVRTQLTEQYRFWR
jgi:hypothetical protein